MEYEIITSEPFEEWRYSLKDASVKRRVAARLARLECGNFGDYKPLGDGLYELRFFFGGGLRIYYTFEGETLVLLLAGGDKSSQSRDIEKARELMKRSEA